MGKSTIENRILTCKTCPLEDLFWLNVLGDGAKEKILIELFYNKGLDFSCLNRQLKLCSEQSSNASQLFLNILEKYSCSDLLNVISKNFEEYPIDKKDICQFSDFDDCYFKVIHFAIGSGLQGISFEKMGYLLRENPRKEGADKKYGENQGKTAVQLGLMETRGSSDFWPSSLGLAFDSLSKERKDKLLPKLCLHIPIIQNYFVLGQDEQLIESYIQKLALSTQIRRRSNVRKLINIVKDALANEL